MAIGAKYMKRDTERPVNYCSSAALRLLLDGVNFFMGDVFT